MINGIVNVYKEKGYTSHDVVARLRGILRQKKIGHTGTLDPEAEGVLPVCLGRGTRLCDMLTDEKKTYVAGLYLGITTDTQDMTGKKLVEKSIAGITEDQVRQAAASFLGDQMQIPPMYSALKVNGKKLYELARQGKEVERKPRPVTFYRIQILEVELPRVRIEVCCSKGTYIRTLCHDIGQKLGCGGCMETLKRTSVGRFSVEESLTLDQIALADDFSYVHSVEEMFMEKRAVTVTDRLDKALYNGNSFFYEADIADQEQVRVYSSGNEFIGIYQYEKADSCFHIVKMFYPCPKIS